MALRASWRARDREIRPSCKEAGAAPFAGWTGLGVCVAVAVVAVWTSSWRGAVAVAAAVGADGGVGDGWTAIGPAVVAVVAGWVVVAGWPAVVGAGRPGVVGADRSVEVDATRVAAVAAGGAASDGPTRGGEPHRDEEAELRLVVADDRVDERLAGLAAGAEVVEHLQRRAGGPLDPLEVLLEPLVGRRQLAQCVSAICSRRARTSARAAATSSRTWLIARARIESAWPISVCRCFWSARLPRPKFRSVQ